MSPTHPRRSGRVRGEEEVKCLNIIMFEHCKLMFEHSKISVALHFVCLSCLSLVLSLIIFKGEETTEQ